MLRQCKYVVCCVKQASNELALILERFGCKNDFVVELHHLFSQVRWVGVTTGSGTICYPVFMEIVVSSYGLIFGLKKVRDRCFYDKPSCALFS